MEALWQLIEVPVLLGAHDSTMVTGYLLVNNPSGLRSSEMIMTPKRKPSL
jgi:hypothetical protein